MNIDAHTSLPLPSLHSFGSALAKAARSAAVAFLVNATTGVGGSAGEVQMTFKSGAIWLIAASCSSSIIAASARPASTSLSGFDGAIALTMVNSFSTSVLPSNATLLTYFGDAKWFDDT